MKAAAASPAVFPLVLLLSMTGATAEAARGRLTLAWDHCRESGSGAAVKTFACDDRPGSSFALIGAFVPGSGVTTLCAADMLLEIASPEGTLAPWWRHPGTQGACRGPSELVATFTNPTNATCDNEYWGNVAGGPFGGWTFTPSSDGAGRSTLRLVVAIDVDAVTPLPQGSETYLWTVQIKRGGTGTCSGCQLPTCLVFAHADLFQTNDDNFAIDDAFTSTGPDAPDRVGWQILEACRGAGNTATSRTWGNIKATYR